MLAKFIYLLGNLMMRLRGWSFHGQTPTERKYIILGAPHTSNWDFILTMGLIYHFRVPLRYMIKDSVFKPPFGGVMRSLGGIPIDRSQHNNVVDSTIAAFQREPEIVLGILPEGTRKYVPYWKSGFYHIAHGAGVPLYLATVDGVKKRVTLAGRVETTGDIVADMKRIAVYYEGISGVVPEKGSPVRVRAQVEAKYGS